MKLLELNERIFQFTGILAADKTPTATVKAILKMISFVVFLGPVTCGVSIKTLLFPSNGMDNLCYAFLLTVGGFMGIGKYLSLKWNEENLCEFIESFRKLFDASKVNYYFYLSIYKRKCCALFAFGDCF